MTTFRIKGFWWNSFRQKTRAISHSPIEDLISFATKNYTSQKPAEIGLLVVAYARCLNNGGDLYTLVERLVISNFAYFATVEGMECLVLLAKSYTDIGQPRRAWLTWRRGLTVAQLLVNISVVFLLPTLVLTSCETIATQGYYYENKDETIQRVWWSIYHGDRFTSLLLGLPHGFSDTYYEALLGGSAENSMPAEHYFTLRCAMLAGKIIQRNIVPREKSFAQSLVIDEEMEEIASSLPEEWWRIPSTLPQSQSELDSLRERILQQFYYFHVRSYLHLPFIASSGPSSNKSAVSQGIAMTSARAMLERFLLLRTEIAPGAPLFECKTSDFVGLTAAVILALCLFGNGALTDPLRYDSDWNLISATNASFKREVQSSGCNMAAQCCQTLKALLHSQYPQSDGCQLKDIFIPYFGRITRRADGPTDPPAVDESRSHNISLGPVLQPTPNQTSIEPTEETTSSLRSTAVSFEYAGYDVPNILSAASPNFNETVDSDMVGSWSDFFLDLNQDWDMFTSYDY